MRNQSEFKEQASSTLQNVAEANKPAAKGSGFERGHFVPLCQYHNPKLAQELSQRLQENGIVVKVRATRMYRYFSVSVEQFARASSLVKEFAIDHPDTRATSISRDYDWAILIGLITIIGFTVTLLVPIFSRFAPLLVLINGVSLAILAESFHRLNKHRERRSITISEIMILTAVVAINMAIWRFVM